MNEKEIEGMLRSLRFELDLLNERQNQWIERVKTLEEKMKIEKDRLPGYMRGLGAREKEILEEEDGPQPL